MRVLGYWTGVNSKVGDVHRGSTIWLNRICIIVFEARLANIIVDALSKAGHYQEILLL
jgi:hypothetical protein